MCGRVVVDYDEMMDVASDTALGAWIQERPAGAESSWNVKPTQQIPMVTTAQGVPRFETAFWSLVPRWAKELKPKFPTFNARAETAAEKRSFAASVRSQRCAIPVTAFYEWTGAKNARVPHAILGPAPILAMAGLYSWWREPGAAEGTGWHLTATILTRASAGAMADLHERMPVFLADDLVDTWLDGREEGDQHLVDAVSEAAVPLADQLRTFPVAPLRGDGPELLRPSERL